MYTCGQASTNRVAGPVALSESQRDDDNLNELAPSQSRVMVLLIRLQIKPFRLSYITYILLL